MMETKTYLRPLIIIGLSLSLPLGIAHAQDDAYMTPADLQTAKEATIREQAKIEAKWRAARQARQEEYERQLKEDQLFIDYYNRREITHEETTPTEKISPELSPITTQDHYRKRGGTYANRLLRFGDHCDNSIIKRNNQIYIIDNYEYNPWADSYYGRDWGKGVNIYIDSRPYNPYFAYRSYWGDNWFDPIFDASYFPYYDPWYTPHFSFSYRYPTRWYYPHHYNWNGGYNMGYWDGFHDSYSQQVSRRTNSFGRTAYSYSRSSDAYGKRLGRRNENYENSYNRHYESPYRRSSEINHRWSNPSYTPSTRTSNPTPQTTPSSPSRNGGNSSNWNHGSGGSRH